MKREPAVNLKKKRSFYFVFKLSLFLLPAVLGIGLISFIAIYEYAASQAKISQEIASYEEHIKARMADEVEKAVTIADFYYTKNHDNMNSQAIKLAIVDLLERLHSDDVGYFFAADYEGNNMLGPSKGSNFYDIEDKNGLKVVQALIAASRQGGGYVEYVMPPLDGVEQVPKISYVLPFQPFEWYIGAGVNLSEIDAIKAGIINESVQRSLKAILIMSGLVILLTLALARYNSRLYRRIEKEINRIKVFLEQSAIGEATLDTGSLSILELEQIGEQSVSMVEKRKENQKRIEMIVNTLPDVIFIIDSSGNFLDCEAGGKKWLGLTRDEFIGKNIHDILPADIAAACEIKISEALKSDQLLNHDCRIRSGANDDFYEVRFKNFKNNQVFTIVRNVTEMKKIQLTNEYLSYHDQLTGVYNRRYFEEALIRLDDPDCLPVAIAMVDVNGLKMTNDAFGHQTGDQLLCLVVDILERHYSDADGFIARIGGDEFVIVCPATSQPVMEKLVSYIYEAVSREREQHSILSISIGWEMKTRTDQSMTDIFNKAEEHMYHKKLTESQSIRHQTIQAIMKTLNEKNEREKIHSERVSQISRLIGSAMGLDYGTVKEIETAGLMHDIGKIAVDDEILNKARALTSEEYEKVKKHPESSYQILKSINAYAALAEDVLSHHERWDGKGYPRRLKGSEISLIARIIAVADSYEAMTADRPYRSAMPKQAALAELQRCAGSQFDPDIVAVFADKVIGQL